MARTAKSKKSRAKKGYGSIRERSRKNKDGTITRFYEGRVTLGYDENGKPEQKSISRSTKKDVEEEIRLLLAEKTIRDADKEASPRSALNPQDEKAESHTIDPYITVYDYCLYWIQYVFQDAESSRRTYRGDINRYVKPVLGEIIVRDLTHQQVQLWVTEMQNANYYARSFAPKTIVDAFRLFQEIMAHAVLDGIRAKNPCTGVKLPKVPKSSQDDLKLLSEQDIRNLLSQMSGHKHERLYKFSLFFGLRQMENLGLTIGDIDFEKKVIHLRFQLRKNLSEKIKPGETLHFKPLKDYDSRDLYFDEEVEKLLLAQIAYERSKKKRLGSAWPTKELERGDLLFSNDNGSYLSYRTIYDCFKRIAVKAGLDSCPHDLRHAYAMLSLEAGNSVKAVAYHLGHATTEFTQRVYNYITKEMKAREAVKMNGVIKAFFPES